MSVFRPFQFISKLDIEARALDIWLKMSESGDRLELPVDASIIAEFLNLDIVWDAFPKMKRE